LSHAKTLEEKGSNLNNQVRKFLSKVFNAGSPLFTSYDKLKNKMCAFLDSEQFFASNYMKDKFTETDFKVKLINQRRSKNNNIGK
jgi:hypothetical protein